MHNSKQLIQTTHVNKSYVSLHVPEIKVSKIITMKDCGEERYQLAHVMKAHLGQKTAMETLGRVPKCTYWWSISHTHHSISKPGSHTFTNYNSLKKRRIAAMTLSGIQIMTPGMVSNETRIS